MTSEEEKISPDLIAKCSAGDRLSQSSLYQKLAPKMFAMCLRYARNTAEAEDVLQEGFLQVFKKIHQYEYRGAFEGWVRKIFVNCALQRLRNKIHLYPVMDAETYLEEPSESAVERVEVKELILMVQQLPPVYRLVFNLYVFEGWKHKDIAKALGISIGTSKSNLNAARRILQKAITERNIPGTVPAMK